MSTSIRINLCFLFATICFIDGLITLAGQTPEYFSGNLLKAEDNFILVVYALKQGPSVFVIFGVCWIFLWGIIILKSNNFISQIIALSLIMGHTMGALSWLIGYYQLDYLIICFLIIPLISYLFIVTITPEDR